MTSLGCDHSLVARFIVLFEAVFSYELAIVLGLDLAPIWVERGLSEILIVLIYLRLSEAVLRIVFFTELAALCVEPILYRVSLRVKIQPLLLRS